MSMAHLLEWTMVGETEVLLRNLPQCHHKSHMLTWERTRAAAVGSRRLTSWAMARPFGISYSLSHTKFEIGTERVGFITANVMKTLHFHEVPYSGKKLSISQCLFSFYVIASNRAKYSLEQTIHLDQGMRKLSTENKPARFIVRYRVNTWERIIKKNHDILQLQQWLYGRDLIL
jgi:hypothetical protein